MATVDHAILVRELVRLNCPDGAWAQRAIKEAEQEGKLDAFELSNALASRIMQSVPPSLFDALLNLPSEVQQEIGAIKDQIEGALAKGVEATDAKTIEALRVGFEVELPKAKDRLMGLLLQHSAPPKLREVLSKAVDLSASLGIAVARSLKA